MAPSAPPGLAPGPADSSEEQLQKEITNTIERQVAQLLQQARNETEGKVKIELKTIIEKIMVMERTLDQLNAQLDAIDPPSKDGPAQGGAVSAESVGQLLSKVEQQWGQEIKTLKEELHQTILAHNHNADLIKHHKETLDALQERSHKIANQNMKPTDVQAQLNKLDARLKQQQKQRKLEPLLERIQVLESHVARAAQQSAAWRFPGMGGLGAPGMSSMLPPGMLGAGLPGLNSADAAASLLP